MLLKEGDQAPYLLRFEKKALGIQTWAVFCLLWFWLLVGGNVDTCVLRPT